MIAWFAVLGFLIGFLVGVVARDAYDLLRAKGPLMRRHFPRPTEQGVQWALLCVFIASSLVVSLMLLNSRAAEQSTERELTSFTACTNRWQQSFASAYTARLAPSIVVQEALDQIIKTVNDGKPAEIQAAVTHYLALRAKQNADRAKTPFPPLPATTCGVPPK